MKIDSSMINSEDIVFHYTKMSVAVEHILAENTLKLSRGSNTHDPREYGEWSLSPHLEGADFSDQQFFREWPEAEKALNNVVRSYKFVSFCCNDPSRPGTNVHKRHTRLTGYDRLRMWAQYGEDFYGVCIAFSAQALQARLHQRLGDKALVFLDRVHYDESLAINDGRLSDADANDFMGNDKTEWANRFVRDNVRDIFFKKHTDFGDENEFRIVVHDPHDSFEADPLDITDCVRAVLLGDRFKGVYLDLMKALCERHHVVCARLGWECGRLKLEDVYDP